MPPAPDRGPTGRAFAKLALGALGVVYGDIGTSPLYAFKECFAGTHGVTASADNVLGVVSLVFWSLLLAVTLKYLAFIMRADNAGEGGILALLALIEPKDEASRTRGRLALCLVAVFGAALLYGDGVITPAISVLSAVEGLDSAAAAHGASHSWVAGYVLPITVVILVALFLLQRRGTARVGAIFGPITLVWFVAIAAIGVPWILREPRILLAVSPWYAVRLLATRPEGFFVLGAVVLCITGAEALYADMGHFGRRPIRAAWAAVVLPSLLLNYFGQGAHVLAVGARGAEDPFFGLVGGWWKYPLVLLATLATVVASQALISGAFSLTRQAMQLGYWPRMTVVHTSGETEGQIFIPEINGFLMISCIALVLGFESSSALAAAYGIAVTATMTITSILFYDVVRRRWNPWVARALVAVFLVVDVGFLSANVAKIEHGGWFPILVAAAFYTLMTTWKRGRSALGETMRAAALPVGLFMKDVDTSPPPRVKGTAVFMSSGLGGVPPVLLHHFKHNKVLHEQVILLSIQSERVPRVSKKKRVEVEDLGHGFYRVIARYGFMQSATVSDVLRRCADVGLRTEEADTSFYLGRETLLTTGSSGLPRWRKALFAVMSRNARPATAFFALPANRVVEMGMQIEL